MSSKYRHAEVDLIADRTPDIMAAVASIERTAAVLAIPDLAHRAGCVRELGIAQARLIENLRALIYSARLAPIRRRRKRKAK